MPTDPDVAVLQVKTHGLSPEAYAAAIRDRLPDHEVALAHTPAEEYDLLERAPVATGFDVDPDALPSTSPLRLFACVYAGTDHLPLDDLERRGVAVTSASGVHAPNAAEQAVGAALAFARRLPTGWRRQRRRQWRHYQTRELNGSTVTVVGMGAIGTAILERLEPFGVHRVGVRHTPEKGGPAEEVVGYGDAMSAFARSDYLFLACPLTDVTRGLVDAAALQTLPPDAVLVNVARGEVVDTAALVDALRGNTVGGAYLDVTDPEPLPEDHPLWGFENVLVTPHNAGYTPDYWERVADVLARNVARLEAGDLADLENRVA